MFEIKKYKYKDDKPKNYFSNPDFVDSITLNGILVEGFPVFQEHYERTGNSFEKLAGDFDITFSRLEETLTTVNNDTLETFLTTNLNNHCLIFKATISGRSFEGKIDISRINIVDDLTNDGYKIQVTVFGISKEVSLAFTGKPRLLNYSTVPINAYLKNYHFKMANGDNPPSYFEVDTSLLNWVERVGYEPHLINEVWQVILNNGYADNSNTFDLFIDLCNAFGLIYKVDIVATLGNYFVFKLSLAFRDVGFSTDTINVSWTHRERGFVVDDNANVIQCFKFMKRANIISSGVKPIEIDENNFYGMVFNEDNITTADGDVYSLAGGYGEESLYSSNDNLTINKLSNPFPFSITDSVNYVDMNYYFPTNYFTAGSWHYFVLGNSISGWYNNPQVRQAKYISFPRLFTKTGYTIEYFAPPFSEQNITIIKHNDNIHTLWYDLIEKTAGTCYRYLLDGFKRTVTGTISLLDSYNVKVFDKIIVNSDTYTIYELMNLDLNQREVDIYASEI